MKATKILDAMNYIDDDLIHEADEVRAGKQITKPKAKVTAIWGAIAAAAIVLVVGGIVVLTMSKSSVKDSDYTHAGIKSEDSDRRDNAAACETAAAISDEVWELPEVAEEIDSILNGAATDEEDEFDSAICLSSVNFDIDGDGVNEELTVGFGPSSGVFTISITASCEDSVKYRNTFLVNLTCYEISFREVDGNLKLFFDNESRDVYVEGDRIVVEGLDYWGGSDLNMGLEE